MMDYFLVIVGLILLFLGGEALVRGAVIIAKRLGISTILIGVVVVGFGTSTPELIVSIQASLANEPDIALGNVVGSNIANFLLILGLSAVITPIICKDKAIRRDATTVVLATLALLGLSYFQIISRISATLMLIALTAYLIYSYHAERQDKLYSNIQRSTAHEHEASAFNMKFKLGTSILIALVGIFMLVFGADFLIQGASNIAKAFGISEAVIGLSVVAIGTSLPELATAISAAIKKHSDVIIGNVLGSNLFNILSILSITSLINPIPITGQIAIFDIPFALTISLVSLAIILYAQRIGRVAGILFLLTYALYILWIYSI